jgi:hypothetical protein
MSLYVVQQYPTSAILTDVRIQKPPPVRVITRCRKLKAIDMHCFNEDIVKSSLLTAPASDLTELVQQYDSVLASVLDVCPCSMH